MRSQLPSLTERDNLSKNPKAGIREDDLNAFRTRLSFVVGWFACPGLTLWVNPALADLDEYIRKPEPAFAWEQNGKAHHGAAGDLIL